MKEFKEQILSISSGKLNQSQLLSILVLASQMLEIETVSEMARKEGKTPRGILISNNYQKVSISKAKFAVKGLAEESSLPI